MCQSSVQGMGKAISLTDDLLLVVGVKHFLHFCIAIAFSYQAYTTFIIKNKNYFLQMENPYY